MMGQINFQFHITPRELLDLLKTFSAEHDLVMVLERYAPPRQTGKLSPAELVPAWRAMRKIDVVYIYKSNEAADAERDPLIVNVGTKRRLALGETQWGGRTNNATLFGLWKSLTAKLKRELPERGYVHSPLTGLFSEKPSRLLSNAAAAGSRDLGLRLALIGKNEVRLEKQ